jgi:hypothetical protein
MRDTSSSGEAIKPMIQFGLALIVVLAGVSVGSVVVLRQSRPGQSQRPFPMPKTNALATNAPLAAPPSSRP